MYNQILRIATIFLIVFISCNNLISQESSSPYVEVESEAKDPFFYRTLGFSFREDNDAVNGDQKDNKNFQDFIQWNSPFSYIGLPLYGDFHFKNYSFVDEDNGFGKYNYFLAVAKIVPSLYLFDSDKNKGNIRLSLGTEIRIWKKRRRPLRSTYDWEPSNAIKTPSYRPGVFYSRLLGNKVKDNKTITDYIEIGFAHHSNGQDAPTLASQDSTLLLPSEYKYNINDGDFSTNIISFSLNRMIRLDKFGSMIHGLKIEFDGIGTPRVEHEDLNIYRLTYKFNLLKNAKSRDLNSDLLSDHRLEFELGFGFSKLDDIQMSRALSIGMTYHYRLPFTKRFALFLSYGYKGQDDYNIFLEQSLHYLKFGFSSIIN